MRKLIALTVLVLSTLSMQTYANDDVDIVLNEEVIEQYLDQEFEEQFEEVEEDIDEDGEEEIAEDIEESIAEEMEDLDDIDERE